MNSLELEDKLKKTTVKSIKSLILKENKHIHLRRDEDKVNERLSHELKNLENAGLIEVKKIRYDTVHNKIYIKYLPLTGAYKIINKTNKYSTYKTVNININEYNEALGVYDQLERILLIND